MTDYNDGKWHGWNGGECPVDLDSEVETSWRYGAGDFRASKSIGPARSCLWEGNEYGNIIAFRVTKPAPPKPREWWITEFDGLVWNSPSVAEQHNAGFKSLAGEIVHVREVLK